LIFALKDFVSADRCSPHISNRHSRRIGRRFHLREALLTGLNKKSHLAFLPDGGPTITNPLKKNFPSSIFHRPEILFGSGFFYTKERENQWKNYGILLPA